MGQVTYLMLDFMPDFPPLVKNLLWGNGSNNPLVRDPRATRVSILLEEAGRSAMMGFLYGE